MRNILCQIGLFLAGLLLINEVSGQNVISDIDTVAFSLPNMHKNSFRFLTRAANISELFEWGGNLYQFTYQGAKEIQYSDLESKFVQYKADPTLRNIGDGAMTLITGIGFNSSVDGRIEISAKIICNDNLPDWNIIMYCDGYVETERERVQDEDGFNSVATNSNYVHNWSKNASGILLEGNDTIGFFRIVMNPLEDSLLQSYSADIYPHLQVHTKNKVIVKSDFSSKTASEIDFGISGVFRDKDFVIISDGTERKTWIFFNEERISMFQEYRSINRKYQIMPYLLLNKHISEPGRRDLIRISIMSRCMNIVLNQL